MRISMTDIGLAPAYLVVFCFQIATCILITPLLLIAIVVRLCDLSAFGVRTVLQKYKSRAQAARDAYLIAQAADAPRWWEKPGVQCSIREIPIGAVFLIVSHHREHKKVYCCRREVDGWMQDGRTAYLFSTSRRTLLCCMTLEFDVDPLTIDWKQECSRALLPDSSGEPHLSVMLVIDVLEKPVAITIAQF